MFYTPPGSNRRRRIDPNPIYDWETDTYSNEFYSFTLPDNTTAFFSIDQYDFTPEYDEEYHETTIRVWLPTRPHSFTFVHKEHYDRQPRWL